jgi:nucleoside permease NupC
MSHPNGRNKICPGCGENCDSSAVIDIIHTQEICYCAAWPYAHLVGTPWHKACFVAAYLAQQANERELASGEVNQNQK